MKLFQYAGLRAAERPPTTPSPVKCSSDMQEEYVHMAVSSWGNSVGIAYLETCSGQVFCVQAEEDITGPFKFQTVQLAKVHANPDVIYVSSKVDPELLDVLKSPVDPTDLASTSYDVRHEKSSLFMPEQARAMLESIHVAGTASGLQSREKMHLLNTMIDLSRQQQVCSLGALLAIMYREGLSSNAKCDGSVGISVNKLSELSLDGYLTVDPASMSALQIFQEEEHPSAMGIGKVKEGFSVFNVMNKCVSPMGRRLLRLWFARPIINLAVLNDRLSTQDFFMRRPDAVQCLRDAIKKVKDTPRILSRLRSMQSLPEPKEFVLLLDSISNTLLVRDTLMHMITDADAMTVSCQSHSIMSTPRLDDHSQTKAEQPPNIIFKAASVIREDLVACHNLISTVLDLEQKNEQMIIAYGISEELDELKQTYFALPDFLTQVMQAEVQRIPRELLHNLQHHLWSIVYMPQVGFVMRLEGGKLRADLAEYLHDYQFAFEGNSEEGFGTYYYTNCTCQLNMQYGDMLHKIHDLEVSICAQLVQRLGEFSQHIQYASEAVAELDCILSLSLAACELRLQRPVLTKANEIIIKNGRHLLTDIMVENYIPNDTTMLANKDRIQVVTGPNFSGKSCYAKQVALITFLAHVGSFVPADEAHIGLTDRIFTRLASRESAAIPQSTFMIDLTQVSSMLRHSSERSLCIIDEFGKGTLGTDGLGLLCATVQHLASRSTSPKVILSTHFSEILNPQYLPRSPQLAFYTMRVVVHYGLKNQPTQQHNVNTEHPNPAGSLMADKGQRNCKLDMQRPADSPRCRAGGAPKKGEDVIFLYQLAPGHAAPSFGVHCAQLAGMRQVQDVVDRAQQVIEAQCTGAALQADAAGKLAARYNRYKGLVQRLLDMRIHHVQEATVFLEEASKSIKHFTEC